jgi:hypothetical protein
MIAVSTSHCLGIAEGINRSLHAKAKNRGKLNLPDACGLPTSTRAPRHRQDHTRTPFSNVTTFIVMALSV